MSDADTSALVAMLRQIQCEPAFFDTYSMASAAERAADAIERLSLSATAEAEHAAQLRKALIAARSHIDNLHGEIGRRTYQQEELEVTTAFDGLGDGQFNGDWASIMGIIDAAMEKANG